MEQMHFYFCYGYLKAVVCLFLTVTEEFELNITVNFISIFFLNMV